MYSLANAFDNQDIKEFIKRSVKFLNLDNDDDFQYICEPKIDGLSLNLVYKNGILISASTRGDGFIGEDVTENILNIKNGWLPQNIVYGNELYCDTPRTIKYMNNCYTKNLLFEVDISNDQEVLNTFNTKIDKKLPKQIFTKTYELG